MSKQSWENDSTDYDAGYKDGLKDGKVLAINVVSHIREALKVEGDYADLDHIFLRLDECMIKAFRKAVREY